MDIILYILIILIPLIAQLNITINYNRYKIKNNKKITGFDTAKKILEKNGLSNIYVVETSGVLSDHYDPKRKVIRLSHDTFHNATIASISIAAHECGHAIQDKNNYKFMKIRSLLVPVVNFTSMFSWIAILIGLFTQYFNIFAIGISLISLGLLFEIVTLPVEIDASKRAKEELEKLNIIEKEEVRDVKSMLKAAAMTYIASVLTSILQILRLVLIFRNDD